MAFKTSISKKRDFDLIYKRGISYKDGFLIIRFIKNDLDYSRLSFVISQKVSKSAVKRNRIRRVLKEATKDYLKAFNKNIDSILIVCPGFEESKANNSVENIFKKAKLI